MVQQSTDYHMVFSNLFLIFGQTMSQIFWRLLE